MRERRRKGNMGGLMVLLLFTVFAVCVLSVLLTGAQSYRDLTARDQESYERRTAAQYLTTKVRQHDAAGMVFVGEFQTMSPDSQGDTLCLKEQIDGAIYYTCIYCHDGYVRELFAQPEIGFSPEDGEKILPAQSVAFCMEDGRLTAEVEHLNGQKDRIVLNLRSGEVAS